MQAFASIHVTHQQVWMCACKQAHKYTNTQTQWKYKSASVESVYRNLTGGILSPSAPQRHDQWGARDLTAASWAQSVRHCAEGGLGQTAGGDGAWVDGQSPSGWDEVHQRGEWKQTQTSSQAFRSTHHCFNITCMQGCVGCFVDNICTLCVSVYRWEILWRRWESGCTGSLEECSNQCRSFRRKSG